MSSLRSKKDKSPIVILGVPYKEGNRNEMRIHVGSLFRFTYRKDFPSLHPYPISSDAGWGCMLRSAQMMMACALQRHLLGKDWRKSENINVLRESPDYCNILRWFSDYPGAPHIYSIHHLVQCGMRYDKLPGEWFGPSTAALVLRDLTKLHRSKYGGPLEVLVTQGDTIYIRDCENLCSCIPKECSLDALRNPLNCSDNDIDKDVDFLDYNVSVGATGNCNGLASGDTNPSIHSAYVLTTSFNANSSGNVLTTIENLEKLHIRNSTELSESNNGIINMNLAPSSSSSHLHSPASTLLSNDIDNTSTSSSLNAKLNDKTKKSELEPSISTSTNTKNVICTNKTIYTSGSSTQGPPLFDPLLNPPPSYTSPWDCSLVVCIPLRLGITSVSTEYIEELKELLRSPWSLGFIGGRMNHAIYFTGYRSTINGNTELLGLDPHSVYSANKDDPFPSSDLVSQVHVPELDALDSSRLDPSLAIALYFRNREEFELFCDETRSNVEKKKQAGITPLFFIQHSAPSYISYEWSGDDQVDEDEGDDCEEDEYILV